MRTTKQLNINNTFRSLNFNFYNPKEKNKLYLSRLSNKKVKALLDKSEDGLASYTFVVDYHSIKHAKYFNEIFKSKAKILYPVSSIFPINLLFELGNRRNFEVLYEYKDYYTTETLINMDTVSKVYNIGVVVKAEPNVNIANYLFGLNDLRYTLVYRVYFDFTQDKQVNENYYKNDKYNTYDLLPEKKIEAFSVIHECLARWRIQCYVGCIDNYSYTKIIELLGKVK